MRVLKLTLVLALVFAAVGAAPNGLSDTSLHRAIVTFEGESLPSTLDVELEALGAVEYVGFETINAVALTAPVASLKRLAADPRVRAVTSERQIELHLYSSVSQIGADLVHEGITYEVGNADGTKQVFEVPGVNGAGQTVAILDTGVFAAHPDLQDRVVKHLNFEFAYGVQMLDASQLDAYAEATGPSNISDDIGHGTHVAGIVAGSGAASQGRENHGVAPGADIVDLRIAAGPVQGLVEDTGWERNAIAAFDWIVRHHADAEFGDVGIGVNTNSWGLTGSDLLFEAPEYDPLAAIIRAVDAEGVTTVFSAGNDGADDNVTDDTIPNGMPEVVSVAASCKPDANTSACNPQLDDDLADFTSHGPAVDVAAPGVGILSTVQPASLIGVLGKSGLYGNHWGDTPDQQAVHRAAYGTASGTSMAAPHVAGVVALLLEANPDLTPEQVRTTLSETANDMVNPFDGLVNPGFDIVSGHGLVDVPESVSKVDFLTR